MDKSRHNADQVLRQVWFPGAHGNVGGGHAVKRGLSDVALRWMMDSVNDLGLGLQTDATLIPTGIQENWLIDLHNEPKGIFRLTGRNERKVTAEFEALHPSVKRRWRERRDYRPDNLRAAHGPRLDEWSE